MPTEAVWCGEPVEEEAVAEEDQVEEMAEQLVQEACQEAQIISADPPRVSAYLVFSN